MLIIYVIDLSIKNKITDGGSYFYKNQNADGFSHMRFSENAQCFAGTSL